MWKATPDARFHMTERSGGAHPTLVVRFTRAERALHWIYALLFLALLATGLALWVPSLSIVVGERALLRRVHIICGVALVALPLAVAVLGGRRMRATLLDIDQFDRDDWAFLRRRPATSGRFNGGQKANTIWTVTAGGLFFVSGVVQWQWSRFPMAWRTGSSELHDLLTIVSAVVVLGHVYLATINPSTRHSTRGIIAGTVRRDWALRHHPAWLRDEPPA